MIDVGYVPTEEIAADCLTKLLKRQKSRASPRMVGLYEDDGRGGNKQTQPHAEWECWRRLEYLKTSGSGSLTPTYEEADQINAAVSGRRYTLLIASPSRLGDDVSIFRRVADVDPCNYKLVFRP